MMGKQRKLFQGVVAFLALLIFSLPAFAETKLDYRQREAVKRQVWNMNDVDKKMGAGAAGQEIQWLQNKLDSILADLQKNNCPDDNSQVASLKDRVAKARLALGGQVVETPPPAAAAPPPPPVVAAPAAVPVPAPTAVAPPAEVKMSYGARQAVERQERNMADIEKKIASGEIDVSSNPGWVVQKLKSMLDDLSFNKAPENNNKAKALRQRITKVQNDLAAAAGSQTGQQATQEKAAPQPAATSKPKAPKLPPGAMQAVNRQWNKVKSVIGVLQQLWNDVEAATVLKRWDERNITFSLSGVQSDLDKNSVPSSHPYYQKIMNKRQEILDSVAELKTIAQSKIDAYANATNVDNYPHVKEDIERADALAHMYQNVGISNLKDPAKATKFLGQADKVEDFIVESRKTYAPLIEHKKGAGNSLETKLKWLEKNFEKFKKVREDFNQQVPADIKQLLSRADGMMTKAQERKNPQMFTGGVAQSMEMAKGLLESLTLSKGKDDPTVLDLGKIMATSQQKADTTAKALEEEILAETKAPEEKYGGGDGDTLKKRIRDAWKKENPGDEIMDVRIVTADWERTISWDYNAAGVWYKSDKSFLGFIVIVKTDSKIATLYPAFINRDNLKKKESTVTSHESTYVIRRMLVKNVS